MAIAVTMPELIHAADQLAWDKTFPQSDKVIHQKVSFNNRLGINLVADLYLPKNLGRIENPSELSSAVGSGNVKVTFELQ